MPSPIAALVGVASRALAGKVGQTAAKEVAEEGGKKLGQKVLEQGPGMAESEQEVLFESFRQLDVYRA